MRASKPLTVTLTKQLAARVKARVKSGEYASESEVIRAGLRELEMREDAHEAEVKHWLRTEVKSRLKEHEKAPDEVLPAEEVFRRLRARVRSRGKVAIKKSKK